MDLKDSFSLIKIRDSIFRTKSKYNPNLIANLSKEAYDIYLMRMSICDDLLKKLDEEGISLEKLKDYINENLNETKQELEKAKKDKSITKIAHIDPGKPLEKVVDQEKINLLKATIEEWEQYL